MGLTPWGSWQEYQQYLNTLPYIEGISDPSLRPVDMAYVNYSAGVAEIAAERYANAIAEQNKSESISAQVPSDVKEAIKDSISASNSKSYVVGDTKVRIPDQVGHRFRSEVGH